MIGRKGRLRSEVVQLGYISPWKLQQDTSRNYDLQLFLSKNAPTYEEIASPKIRLARTEALTAMKKNREALPQNKKTARTEAQGRTMDFRQSLHQTCNRKFYSRSASLPTRPRCTTEAPLKEEEAIFARRCRESKRPKLVTLGNCSVLPSQNLPASGGIRRKRQFMLRKQSMTQESLKEQIVSQKGFIASLEGCLMELKEQRQGGGLLANTMKKFLSHYKRL